MNNNIIFTISRSNCVFLYLLHREGLFITGLNSLRSALLYIL